MKYVIPRCSVSLPLNSFAKSACGFKLSPKNNPIDESPYDPNVITSATFAEDVEVQVTEPGKSRASSVKFTAANGKDTLTPPTRLLGDAETIQPVT